MPTMIDGLSGMLQAIEFSGETVGDDQFAHEQAPNSTSQSSCSYASHTRRGTVTIDVTMGLTPVTFRVPGEVSQRFGLSWHQFVMGDTVENSIRDGNDQLVTKDETKDMCRVMESTQQHGKISKPTSHFTSSHNMVTIYHQDTVT